MRSLYLLLFTIYFTTHLPAQEISRDSIASRDHIHLHIDKEIYRPGEIIWFKGYVFDASGFPLTNTSTFTQLLDNQGHRLDSFISPVINGTTTGQLMLPDSNAAFELFVVSRSLSSAEENTPFIKKIWIVPESFKETRIQGNPETISLFPEGDILVNNVPNRVAFRAQYADSNPMDFRGYLKSTDGKVIDTITSVHAGMGSFMFTPLSGKRYLLEWKSAGSISQYPLPAAVDQGVGLQVTQSAGNLHFLINDPFPTGTLSLLYVVLYSQDKKVYEASVHPKTNIISATIPKEPVANGVAWLHVYDKNRNLLANRPVFVDHKDYTFSTFIQSIENQNDSVQMKQIQIATTDTLSAQLSVSIVAMDDMENRNGNLFSSILLPSNSSIYKPGQYADDMATKRDEYLDLAILTMDRDHLSRANSTLSTPGHPNVQYLGYTGIVTDLNNKPLPDIPVAVMIRTRDTASVVFTEMTDQQGKFYRDGLLFVDSASIYYSVTKSKADKFKVTLKPVHHFDPPSIPLFSHNNRTRHFEKISEPGKTISKEDAEPAPVIDTIEASGNEGKTLEEVKVISKIDLLKKMDEKYASPAMQGYFGGRMYDFMNDPVASRSFNPIRHIRTWMMPTRIHNNCYQVYVDERFISPNNYRQLYGIRAADIAFVKYIPYDPNSMCSGLYVYLKKDDDYGNDPRFQSKMHRLRMAGYSRALEFESARQNIFEGVLKTKKQSTVYWNPDLQLNNENKSAIINFKPSEPGTKYLVVVEGINEIGQFTYSELIIE